MLKFDSVTKSKEAFMRGGKRENAGRKGTGKTKTIRIPIEIESSVLKLIAEHKVNLNALPEEKSKFDSVTKRKDIYR